jgi:hypothetical protein
VIDFERRPLFGGSLTLLTGCDISDHDSVQRALAVMSRFNDRVQAAIFGRDHVGFECADGYYEGHRHAHRPASADADGVQIVR